MVIMVYFHQLGAGKFVQDGAPKIAKLPYKWLNSMVYGRYNELVNGGYIYIMVYKPTWNWGAPSCKNY